MYLIKSEKFNTNNSWGFGGEVGTETYYNFKGYTFSSRDGKACFRHHPSGKFSKKFVCIDSEVVEIFSNKHPESGWLPAPEDIKEIKQLFVYENENGWKVASIENLGTEFKDKFHQYKLILTI